jgi:signal transduction histidine kinase/ActR/RegA family two-component response regulator/HAMP domain-containing protein
VGTVFLAVAPAWLVTYLIAQKTGSQAELEWTLLSGGVGLLALAAAWFGGEHFVLRQVRMLHGAARLLAAGDLSSRTGLRNEKGELGDLARTFDEMANTLQERVKEREEAEKNLLVRALQQTAISALGQFALSTKDFPALLDQAVMMVAQNLEVEFCGVFELDSGSQTLLLRAGVGWKPGTVATARMTLETVAQAGFTLKAAEPIALEGEEGEKRFRASPLLQEHGIASSLTIGIAGDSQAFGVLGAYTSRVRKFTGDEIHFLMAVANVVAMAAASHAAEAERERLAAFARLSPNAVLELSGEGKVTYYNEAAMQLARDLGLGNPSELLPGNIPSIVNTCLEDGQNRITLQTQYEGRQLSWLFHAVVASRVVHTYVDDITDRLNLQAQLRQSQKMESVGQLAAGVAHDFNNMLTIIQGHAGLLLAKASSSPEVLDSAQAVYFAAERAAGLTRQLLMFSRKNVMQLQVLDLRSVVAHLASMLRRLLGETIKLQFTPPSELPPVQGDAGMIDQVVMNLAVNARDAMPSGGTLTVSISRVQVEEPFVDTHPEARAGSFVCLQVTDTGCGMDRATLARIFEPFFTTKEVGKGTGLGLATVYGIVKQHQGWIQVHSEPGQGTTFSLFFPAAEGPAPAPTTVSDVTKPVRGGQETILVVEDEPVVREMAQVILQGCGYRTLEAGSGKEALAVWEKHSRTIDLVLTDMVMPEGVSGMDLAERLVTANPRLKVIFASGYSMDNLDAAFIRKPNVLFLQKPYTHLTLARAVRQCLDRELAGTRSADVAAPAS